jgi:hypothetical protein
MAVDEQSVVARDEAVWRFAAERAKAPIVMTLSGGGCLEQPVALEHRPSPQCAPQCEAFPALVAYPHRYQPPTVLLHPPPCLSVDSPTGYAARSAAVVTASLINLITKFNLAAHGQAEEEQQQQQQQESQGQASAAPAGGELPAGQGQEAAGMKERGRKEKRPSGGGGGVAEGDAAV